MIRQALRQLAVLLALALAPALVSGMVQLKRTDRVAVDALAAKAKAFGAKVTAEPADLPRSGGGGYGFAFTSPDGHVLNISCDVARHPNSVSDRSKPMKLSHVVLNSPKIEEQTGFFIDLLGFKLSDTTDMMLRRYRWIWSRWRAPSRTKRTLKPRSSATLAIAVRLISVENSPYELLPSLRIM